MTTKLDYMLGLCLIFTWRISHILSFLKIFIYLFIFKFYFILQPVSSSTSCSIQTLATPLPQPKPHAPLSKYKGFHEESTLWHIKWSRIKTLSPSPALKLSMTSPIGNRFQKACSYIRDKSWSHYQGLLR